VTGHIGGRSFEELVELLLRGEIEVLGLLPYSSNYVFLARVGAEGLNAVYKPQKGEQPLWDFPAGTLAAREVAAYLVSEAGGWNFVPPTVMREDGPLGPGSLQVFIPHDPNRHYFTLMEERPNDFEPFVSFDVVINNADRKGGHVIEDEDGVLWAVDHGLAFNSEPKLRTVIWELAETQLSDDERTRLERFTGALRDDSYLISRLAEVLSAPEAAAVLGRVEGLLETGRYPAPGSARHLPWPLV
jgi:uncharacterized repeat protein (TIGR03843 family)